MSEALKEVEKAAPEHVIEFIYEEMEARGWDEWELARRMGGDPDHNKLALEILDACRQVGVLLGDEGAKQLGRAFGTGAEIWVNLDKTWRDHERLVVERARLEREVIEAAKAYRRADLNSSRDLIYAVDKLEDFESTQETK